MRDTVIIIGMGSGVHARAEYHELIKQIEDTHDVQVINDSLKSEPIKLVAAPIVDYAFYERPNKKPDNAIINSRHKKKRFKFF